MSSPQEIAEVLLRIGAVQINTKDLFVYTTGIKSPIYCDNRRLMSFPLERESITSAFVDSIGLNVGADQVEVLAGVATAGIPFAAWVAARLEKPMVYVRDSVKSHGMSRQIEGVLKAGQRAVVIEDLVTTGTSALISVEAIRSEGATADHCFAIFSYELSQAKQNFDAQGIQVHTLTSISTLLDVAVRDRMITDGDRLAVEDWLSTFGEGGR